MSGVRNTTRAPDLIAACSGGRTRTLAQAGDLLLLVIPAVVLLSRLRGCRFLNDLELQLVVVIGEQEHRWENPLARDYVRGISAKNVGGQTVRRWPATRSMSHSTGK